MAGNPVVRFLLAALPFAFMLVALYVVFRLVFLGKPPTSRPGQESHGHLKE